MLRGLGFEQLAATLVWEEKAACIQIANNPVNRKFTRHIGVRQYYARYLVRHGVMVVIKCTGTHNVADALTKSPSPAWSTHRPYLTGTRIKYKAFFATLGVRIPEAVAAAAA
mmetsp:Transcript_2219/g.4543  ORF Transcript_2219/g.4543 Transcript_2219/m.4543 type:complete len:112 (+) Transcript_2219:117-452(+)